MVHDGTHPKNRSTLRQWLRQIPPWAAVAIPVLLLTIAVLIVSPGLGTASSSDSTTDTLAGVPANPTNAQTVTPTAQPTQPPTIAPTATTPAIAAVTPAVTRTTLTPAPSTPTPTTTTPAVASSSAPPLESMPPPPTPPPLGALDLTAATTAETRHLRLVVQQNNVVDAATVVNVYGTMLDAVSGELSAILNTTGDPITVVVYADQVALDRAVKALDWPPAPGIGMYVDPENREIAASLETLLADSPLETENNFRATIAQVLMVDVAGRALPRGFAIGMAQYVQRPVNARLARLVAVVTNDLQRGNAFSWYDMNRPRPLPAELEAINAYSYASIAYLIEVNGFHGFQTFLVETAAHHDWRAALQAAYDRPALELEDQWHQDLHNWVNGDWKYNAAAAYDLQPARDLFATADYSAAKARLELSQRLYQDIGDTVRSAEAERLTAQCDVGMQAEALMMQVQEALEQHTYDRASHLLGQADAQYALLPPAHRPDTLMTAYTDAVQRGLSASQTLIEAEKRSKRWADYPEARRAAVEAGTIFATLGDEERHKQATILLEDLDSRQQRLVLILVVLAVLTLAWLALWLWARGPMEFNWRETR